MAIFHDIVATLFTSGGPYVYVRLVTAAYAVSAVGRLIPVTRKQVPGYRRRVPVTVCARQSSRRRARRGNGGLPLPRWSH